MTLYTFKKYPQFINTDIRTTRGMDTTTFEVMYARHSILLPETLIKDKNVLDIGCCVGATGAWVLDNGAASYTGIELQEGFVKLANQNLTDCFPESNWKIINTSFEDFFKTNTEKYDIIYAGGVIYANYEYQQFLDDIAKISSDVIVIESLIPRILNLLPNNETSFVYPVTEYYTTGNMVHENGGNMRVHNAVPSAGAVADILSEKGFSIDNQSLFAFRVSKATYSSRRWGAIFKRGNIKQVLSAKDEYQNPTSPISAWKPRDSGIWKFDDSIAPIFVDHARKHIPDYDRVIDLCVDICVTKFQDKHIKIIDIGCATGETLDRLHVAGFKQLFGVDNSESMLKLCNNEIATYITSDNFPTGYGKFDVVLCNWTLHFIKDKIAYLKNIVDSLNENSVFILSDKTMNSDIDLTLYHRFKSSKGVPDFEIKKKAEAVKDIMYINDCAWYLDVLKSIGFTNVSVINAAPCFTTFMATK